MNADKSTSALVRILHVEDSREDAELIRERLTGIDFPVQVDWAANKEEFTTLLQNGVYDLILADYQLPSFDAPSALLQTRARYPSLPFICVSGAIGEEKAVELLKRGATDYVLKDRLYKLPMSVRRAVDEARTQIANKLANDQLLESVAAYTAAKVSVDTVNAIDQGVVLIGMNGIVRYVNPALIRMTGYDRHELEGRNIVDLLPVMVKTSQVDSIISACYDALHGEIQDLTEIVLISKTNHNIHILPRLAFIRDPSGKPSTIVMTILDITERKRTEQQNQVITTLLALFAKTTERKDYLDDVARVIRHWSTCRCMGIRLMNDAGQIPYESYVGFAPEVVQAESILTITDNQCVCTRVIDRHPDALDLPCWTAGGSFRCGNVPLFLRTFVQEGKDQLLGTCIRSGYATVSIVPIRYHNTTVGVLHFADEEEHKMSPEMMAFAESTLAPIVGEAVCRFNAETELRSLSLRLALADEHARRQLAISLHDTVGQTLALGKIRLVALSEMLTAKEPKSTLAEIRGMFEEAVVQIRTLSFELSPPILYELGLGAAIEWLGESFAAKHGFQIEFEGTDRECAISESISILLFQSVRELLTNIVKHAESTRVSISLENCDHSVIMKINDNGKGIAANEMGAAMHKNSLGLFSIRERMKQIGGSFEIQSKQNFGTMVTLTAPERDLAQTGNIGV